MSTVNFKENFYNNFEELHKRFLIKNTSMGNILEIFTKLQIVLRDFTKNINNVIVKDYLLFPEQNSTQNEALEYIKFILTIVTTQFNVEIELIKNKIIDPLRIKKEENIKKEKELYMELKKFNIKYNESLTNIQKAKEKYYQSANVAEMSTKSAKELIFRKLNNDVDKEQQNLSNLLEQKSIEALNEAKKNDEKYKELVKEGNIIREKDIQKQYDLLDFYEKTENTDFQFYKSLILDYLCHLKTENSIIKGNLMQMEEKINEMNLNKDIQLLIKKYSSNKKPDKLIHYQLYKPKFEQKQCFKDDSYKLYYDTIVTLKKYIDICPEFDIKKESIKEELRELCKVLFSLNINYDETVNKKILDILKDESMHDFFLVILSKQRTNGRYCRSKKLILDLGIILNLIINISQKSLNYMPVKTCIILSQTFYYEENNEENNKSDKVYLYHYIKNNLWLKTPDFWRDIINFMIVSELKKLAENNQEKVQKTSLDNIVFSQLLAYGASMKDFKIEQRIILKIIDEIVKKYEISKEFSEMIYNSIGNKEFVEKLRKEYLDNPDLEQNIMDNIEKEKNKELEKKDKSNNNDGINKENIQFNKDNDNEKNRNEEIKEKKEEEVNNMETNKIIEKIQENNIIENVNDNNINEKEENKNEKENLDKENKEINNKIIEKEENNNKIIEKENKLLEKQEIKEEYKDNEDQKNENDVKNNKDKI